jgi:hypothetical protein
MLTLSILPAMMVAYVNDKVAIITKDTTKRKEEK